MFTGFISTHKSYTKSVIKPQPRLEFNGHLKKMTKYLSIWSSLSGAWTTNFRFNEFFLNCFKRIQGRTWTLLPYSLHFLSERWTLDYRDLDKQDLTSCKDYRFFKKKKTFLFFSMIICFTKINFATNLVIYISFSNNYHFAVIAGY